MYRQFFRPLIKAIDTFFRESNENTSSGPHIRDPLDLKRVMMLVVYALFPCVIMAIWNTGVQSFVFESGDPNIMSAYKEASKSLSGYFSFVFSYPGQIISRGCMIFFPILLISYLIGGAWEVLFACLRNHEISEGFLVTGLLFALILPPTIPYWMVAVGVSVGTVIGKEIFGGTGMNILNPALTCRCFLYFSYPSYMTGNIWAGSNATLVQKSLMKINANLPIVDTITGASSLNIAGAPFAIKRIHTEAIASWLNFKEPALIIKEKLLQFNPETTIEKLTPRQLEDFVTATQGLNLSPEFFPAAYKFSLFQHGEGLGSNGNLFFGNMLGSLGETSTLACLIGAALLLWTRIASWRTMLSLAIGAYLTALIFQLASHLGSDAGLFNPARFDLPAYKHMLIGGLAFGLVFMATDPVSSPTMNTAKWAYGILIGALIIIIRVLNPAFPEGVMLAILFGNVFAPLFDHHAVKFYRRGRYESA